VPAFGERLDLFDAIRARFLSTFDPMNEVEIFRDGTVLHGAFRFSGQSTTTPTVPLTVAQNVLATVRTRFAIPASYQFQLDQGGLGERQAVQPMGTWRSVAYFITVNGVQLDRSYVEVQFDETGRMQQVRAMIPRLRPEIVEAAHDTAVITPFHAAVFIKFDADALPAKNEFGITRGKETKFFEFIGRRLIPLVPSTR
jgi:hypothetical protein